MVVENHHQPHLAHLDFQTQIRTDHQLDSPTLLRLYPQPWIFLLFLVQGHSCGLEADEENENSSHAP